MTNGSCFPDLARVLDNKGQVVRELDSEKSLQYLFFFLIWAYYDAPHSLLHIFPMWITAIYHIFPM